MKIELKNIIPYDKNPRKNEKAIEKVLDSLRTHGQVAPLIVSAPGHPFEGHVICAGHTRFEALKKFGATEADCVVHEFKDEAEFVHYNIIDNKTGEYAEWDESVLAELASQFDLDLKEMEFDIVEDSDEFGEDFSLPEGEKQPFQQMTFTLADAQAEKIKEALEFAKSIEIETHGNENSNGNALFAIVSQWVEQRK